MRSARLCASLGIAAVLLAPATALADPAPLPKPATVSPLPKPTTQSPVTPLQPVTQTPVTQTPVTQTPVTRTVTPRRTITPPVTQTPKTPVVPRITSGGRVQPAVPPATLTGGRTEPASLPAKIVELFPTRLSSVGDEALPSYDAWPSWVLGAFTLLASAEAFLLVRLARNRRFAQGDALQPY
jgi:hypothetical protein